MAGSPQWVFHYHFLQVPTITITEDMNSHKRKAKKFTLHTCFHYENPAILEIITEEEETLVLALSSPAFQVSFVLSSPLPLTCAASTHKPH